MLGLTIAATGALVLLAATLVIAAIGKFPGNAIALPLLLAWGAGWVAVLAGAALAVWG